MTATDTATWRRVSPLAILFFLGQIAKRIAQNFWQVIVPAAVFLATTGGFGMERIYSLAAAIAAVVLLLAVANYINLRYSLDERSIVIRSGVFSRTQLNIDFDRVQAVNVTQNPIYRLFSVVDIKLDTPGSAQSEGNLPAVSLSVAAELRARVRKVPTRLGAGTDAAPGEYPETGSGVPLLTLGRKDMIRIGLSSNRALVMLAVIASAWSAITRGTEKFQLGPMIPPPSGNELPVLDGSQALLVLLAALAVTGIFIACLSVAGALLRFDGFTLSRDDANFVARSGFLTIRTHAVSTRKLQLVTLKQSWLLGLFERVSITARQAAGHALSTGGSFQVPIARVGEGEQIARLMFEGEADELELDAASEHFRPIHPRYRRSRWLLAAILPAIALTLLLLIEGAALRAFVLPVVYLPLSAMLVERRYRRWGIQTRDDAIAVRRGLFGTRIDLFLVRKIQQVSLRQSPLQRRHGLTHLEISLASARITVPYLEHERAEALIDEILMRVETTAKPWL